MEIQTDQKRQDLADGAASSYNGAALKKLGDLRSLPRLESLRRDVLSSRYHVCTQKAYLLTRYFIENLPGDFLDKAISRIQFSAYRKSLENSARSKPQAIWQIKLNNAINRFLTKRRNVSPSDYVNHYACALGYILDNMELRIYDHELICGNTSAWRVGAPIHPDLGGLLMLPEIKNIRQRSRNPMDIEQSQIEELENTIFPYWFNRSILALTPLFSNNPSLFNTMLSGESFVLTQFSGISHVTPDYPLVLRLGFKAIARTIQNRIDEIDRELFSSACGKEKDKLVAQMSFLQAGLKCAEAAIRYGKRWNCYLLKAAETEQDGNRKRELLNLADIFTRIPAQPASSFYEALQSLFISHVMLHYENFQHGISFGRMDQYLYPYYKKDIESGVLTHEQAAELIGCFICKAGELVPLFFDRATEYFSGLSSASGITLGGSAEGGKDAVNELSYLFLLAYDQVRLRQPNFHVRVNDGTPEDFLDLCYKVLEKGGGLPAFFNDREISKALQNSGISKSDAEDYSIVGCVEWGCPGKSFPAAGAVFINLPYALNMSLHNSPAIDDKPHPVNALDSFRSIENLEEAFKRQVEILVQQAVEGNNAIEKAHARFRPTPLLSILVDGCIDKGLEINAGGARYNSTGCQGVGLANVVDSFTAIDELVFRAGRISLAELIRILENNFADRPDLHAYILNKVPKYGQHNERCHRFAHAISCLYQEIVANKLNPRGGHYAPGFWSMTTHQGFGARTGALPDGRLAQTPLANGVSPVNGRDTLGPTASLSAAASLFNANVSNGYALNQKLDLIMMKKPGSHALMNGLIRGFFASGGMQVQFNIIDPQILIEARRNPEQHRTLVVRVSGYSAYFNDLTEAVKDELIERTLHDFSSCTC